MRQAVAQFHNIVKGNRTDNAHVVVCVFAPPVQQAGTVEQAHKLAKAKTCVAFVSVADLPSLSSRAVRSSIGSSLSACL